MARLEAGSRTSRSKGSRSKTSRTTPRASSSTCRRSRSSRARRRRPDARRRAPAPARRVRRRGVGAARATGRTSTARSRPRMLDVLWSVASYERLVVDWDLDPKDAIRGVTWVIGLVEDAVREMIGGPSIRVRNREPVEVARVELGDVARFVVGDVVHRVGEHLAAVGPVRVVVREVALPHELVEPDEVAVPDRVPVGDHADPEVLREHLRRQRGCSRRPRTGCAATCSRGARARTAPNPRRLRTARSCSWDALRARREKMRSPSALIELTPHSAMPTDGVVVGRRLKQARRRADVHRQRQAGVGCGREHRVPVAGRERRQPDRVAGSRRSMIAFEPFAAHRSISRDCELRSPTTGSASAG